MTLAVEPLRVAVAEAEALRRRGDLEEAKRRLIAALHASRSDRLGEAALSADVFLVEHIASLAVLSGNPETADLLLDAAGAEHDASGESWRADFATLQRIHIALTADRIDDARERFRETHAIGSVDRFPRTAAELEWWEATRPWPPGWRERLFTSAYLELTRLCIALGSFEQAAVYAERGLRFTRAEATLQIVGDFRVPLLLAAADAQLSQGRLAEARERLAAAGPIDTSRYPAWQAEWLALVTRAAWLEGNLGEAIGHALALLDFCVALRLDRAIAQAKLNLAELRLQLNEHTAARELLDDVAISDAALLHPDVAARLSFLDTFCTEHRTIYFDGPRSVLEQQEQRPVPAHHDENRIFAARGDWNVPHMIRVETLMLQLRASAGDEDLAARLLACVEETDSPLVEARVAFALGLNAYAAGRAGDAARFADAERHLSEARRMFNELGIAAELYECQRWLAWTWRRLGMDESVWRSLRRDNGALLDRIASTLGIQDRAAFFINKWSDEEEDLAEELRDLETLQKAAGRFAVAARMRLLARRNRLIDRLFALRDGFARTVVAGDTATAGPVAIRATPLWRRLLVPPRSASILFLVLPNAVVLFTVSLGRIGCVIMPASRERVRQLVAGCHRDWDESLSEVLAREIGLEAAVQSLPRWVRRLTIVADDVLNGVPFAALPFQDRRLLIHRFAITMAHSAARLPSPRRPHQAPTAVFVGISRGMPDQQLLDNREQLRILRETVASSALSPLDDTTCTPEVLVESLTDADLAHVTCHGLFDPENPHGTGLVLPDGKKGLRLLTLRELSRHQFPRLRLAVLVSCWSADAYVRPGRWVVSAPETLCRAGADSVIAALWEVDNATVAEILEVLYRNLRTMRRDEALRQAQLAVQDTMLPYGWAAFQLHGENGRLHWRGFR